MTTPLTPEQWLEQLVVEAPYLAKGSAGGGTLGNSGSALDTASAGTMDDYYTKRKKELSSR
jgi:hypothetical protein